MTSLPSPNRSPSDDSDPRRSESAASIGDPEGWGPILRGDGLPPLPDELLRTKARHRKVLSQLLAPEVDAQEGISLEPRTESYHILAIGLDTELFIGDPQIKSTYVPFVAAAIDLRDESVSGGRSFRIMPGIFFPDIGAFALYPVGTPRSAVEDSSYIRNLIPALRWMELVERSTYFSPELCTDLLRHAYQGTVTSALEATTGREVIESTFSRPIAEFPEAFINCRKLGIDVSTFDIYRAINSGAVSRSNLTEEIFTHHENVRQTHRIVAPRYAEVAALLTERKWLGWGPVKETIDSAQRNNPHTIRAIEEVAKGVTALKALVIGEGSPISKVYDTVEEVSREIRELLAYPALSQARGATQQMAEKLPGLTERVLSLLSKISYGYPTDVRDRRQSYLDALSDIAESERCFLEVRLKLANLITYFTMEEDYDSLIDHLTSTHGKAIGALRLMRSTYNQCAPGVLIFPNP